MADEKKCCTIAIISIVSVAAVVGILMLVRWMYFLPPPKGNPNWITFFGQVLTAAGALIAAVLLYRSAQKQTRQNEDNLRAQLQTQEKNLQAQLQADKDKLDKELIEKRRTSLNERTSRAVDHLAGTSAAAHYAGIIELAELIDEWGIYQKQAGIQEGMPEAESLQFRRQELCDIIFTTQFPYSPPFNKPLLNDDEKKSKNYQPWRSIQLLRGRLMTEKFGKEAWKGLNLDVADLRYIILNQENLFGISMSAAHLNNAKIYTGNFAGTNLTSADLTGARFLSEEGVHLEGADLSHASFAGAEFRGDIHLKGATLSNTSFAGAEFRGDIHLKGATLSLANFTGVKFEMGDIHLEGAKLTFADFSGTEFKGTVHLEGAKLAAAAFTKAEFWEDVHLEGATLSGATFTKAEFWEDVDLKEAELSDANFTGVKFGLGDIHLEGANLSHARLDHATFWRVDLSGANLSGANLTEAVFYSPEKSSFTGAIYDQFTVFPDGEKYDQTKFPYKDHMKFKKEMCK